MSNDQRNYKKPDLSTLPLKEKIQKVGSQKHKPEIRRQRPAPEASAAEYRSGAPIGARPERRRSSLWRRGRALKSQQQKTAGLLRVGVCLCGVCCTGRDGVSWCGTPTACDWCSRGASCDRVSRSWPDAAPVSACGAARPSAGGSPPEPDT